MKPRMLGVHEGRGCFGWAAALSAPPALVGSSPVGEPDVAGPAPPPPPAPPPLGTRTAGGGMDGCPDGIEAVSEGAAAGHSAPCDPPAPGEQAKPPLRRIALCSRCSVPSVAPSAATAARPSSAPVVGGLGGSEGGAAPAPTFTDTGECAKEALVLRPPPANGCACAGPARGSPCPPCPGMSWLRSVSWRTRTSK